MSRYVDINRLEPQQFENSEVELGVLAYDYEKVQSEPYIDIVRCEECKYKLICNHGVQHTTRDMSSVTIGYKAVNFCSYGQKERASDD